MRNLYIEVDVGRDLHEFHTLLLKKHIQGKMRDLTNAI